MTKNDHLGQSHVIGDAEDLVIAVQIFIKFHLAISTLTTDIVSLLSMEFNFSVGKMFKKMFDIRCFS